MDEKKKTGFLSLLLQPRALLLIWGGLGLVVLAFVYVSAMLPADGNRSNNQESGKPRFQSLLIGEMAKFEPAFPPRKAPFYRFDSPKGEIDLSEFRGKTVLVNLWATWCAPCIEEMPTLDALQAQMGGDDFAVVAIAAGPQGKMPADQFLARHELSNLTLYTDADLDFSGNMGFSSGLPLSILYNAKGEEIGRFSGSANWTSPEAIALIEAVIDGRHP
jgi:thiol-disulfide isomerase/thioredoxin